MPQAVLFAAVGIAALAAYRFLKHEMTRVGDRLAEVRTPAEIDFGARLVRDTDGIYRPERSDRR